MFVGGDFVPWLDEAKVAVDLVKFSQLVSKPCFLNGLTCAVIFRA